MDILPIGNMPRVVETPRHNDELPQRRPPQRQRKREKVVPAAVYKPDGHVEEQAISKIDIVG
jgi:hypothetical protein